MTNERFLDHERVIREIRAAEQHYNLDSHAALEKLKEAYSACSNVIAATEEKIKGLKSGIAAHVVARGKYLEEIKRRVELPAGGSHLRTSKRPGWNNWCVANGLSAYYADTLIAASKGDFSVYLGLQEDRKRRYHRNKVQQGMPVERIKELWQLLTLTERDEFLRWLNSGPATRFGYARKQREARL